MSLTLEEGKARRLAGLKREKAEQSAAERVHRALTTGRPPTSEFKTPMAAVHAAKSLARELGLRMQAEGFSGDTHDGAVSVGYVMPDLSAVGFTRLYSADREDEMVRFLTGNIALGLVFGVVDPEDEPTKVIMGVRPFFTTKQSEAWLEELKTGVRFEIEDILRRQRP